MLDEIINIKIRKIIDREYNRFILTNGALMLLGILATGLSLFMSNSLLYVSLFSYLTYSVLLEMGQRRLKAKLNALLNRALDLKEFREYSSNIEDHFSPGGLDHIKALEEGNVRILTELEEAEERRLKASSEVYRSLISSVKSKVRISSIAGITANIVLIAVLPAPLSIKIVFVAVSIILLYRIDRL
ncbi:MAG: hypothetical protein ABWJ97_04015 [Thermoproteus sp.]